MPTYDFKCHQCGLKDEAFVAYIDRDNEHACPECGCPMERLFPSPRVNLWYVDYRQMDGEKERIDAGIYE